MDKIEKRAQKFMDDNNYVITVLSDDKENDDTWVHNEYTVLADFAKQEREAVRAEIAELMTELDNISAAREIYFDKLLKIKFEHVKKRLNRILESLKGDE